ncbi:YceH family protein [Cerasicoccus maritimus]|uniref:YceH family protein n=1 Tax=Cerasicoccus maritimus TaxID=490089 RepID=UPI002852D6C3|nr:YceH family protein [Cerasicoccus maritimus]
MEPDFNPLELRVLGCLLEKERTTPEQYPLSLNALRLACNQKTSRDPVVDFDEDEVTLALESLRDRGLVYYVRQSGARVTKYRHDVTERLSLRADEISILALLLLRGPQTVGELRTRSDRMHGFGSLEQVEETLQRLIDYEDGSLVQILPRESGRKECRYVHTLAPLNEATHAPAAPEPAISTADVPATPAARAPEPNEVAELRAQVETLTARINELESQFADFRQQFE